MHVGSKSEVVVDAEASVKNRLVVVTSHEVVVQSTANIVSERVVLIWVLVVLYLVLLHGLVDNLLVILSCNILLLRL